MVAQLLHQLLNRQLVDGCKDPHFFGGNVNPASMTVTELFFTSALNACANHIKLKLTMLKLKLTICQKVHGEDSM